MARTRSRSNSSRMNRSTTEVDSMSCRWAVRLGVHCQFPSKDVANAESDGRTSRVVLVAEGDSRRITDD